MTRPRGFGSLGAIWLVVFVLASSGGSLGVTPTGPASSGETTDAVGAGYGFACHANDLGHVACGGEDALPGGGPPEDTVDELAVGSRHACARLAEDRVDCWGPNRYGQADDRAFGERVAELSAGATHSCALVESGRVTCWGGDDGHVAFGQTADRDSLGAIAVSAGGFHTCAVTSEGSVECWDLDREGQARGYDPRSGREVSPPAVDVATGYTHSCALLQTQQVECWGTPSGGFGEHLNGDPVVSVAAGKVGTCVVRGTGAVECAGAIGSPDVRVEVGDGRADERVDVGVDRACAIGLGGDVECWGPTGSRAGPARSK
jgi:hypothetical protein